MKNFTGKLPAAGPLIQPTAALPTAAPSAASAPTRVVSSAEPPVYAAPPPAYAQPQAPYVPAPSPYGGSGGTTVPPRGRGLEQGGRGFPFWSFLLLTLGALCGLGALAVGAAYGGYFSEGGFELPGIGLGPTPTLQIIGSPLPGSPTPTATPTAGSRPRSRRSPPPPPRSTSATCSPGATRSSSCGPRPDTSASHPRSSPWRRVRRWWCASPIGRHRASPPPPPPLFNMSNSVKFPVFKGLGNEDPN